MSKNTNTFFVIRESKRKGFYELWDTFSGKLYGIDKTTQLLLINNKDLIDTSEKLNIFFDIMNDKQMILFNEDYVVLSGENFVILNKYNDDQFIINEIVSDICNILTEEKDLTELLDELGEIYNIEKSEHYEIINIILQLIFYNVILMPAKK